MKRKGQLVEKLQLMPHPEGGFYRETYRSAGMISAYGGIRSFSTAIYFMLTPDSFSAFHKIHQDEVWHFYEGDPICIHMISTDGEYSKVLMGAGDEMHYQFIVPGGTFFASEVLGNNFGLAGCTVAPGFDFDDFEMPSRSQLLAAFPQHQEIIQRLTRN